MLKDAVYINVLLNFLVALYIIISSVKSKNGSILKNLRKTSIVFIIYNIVLLYCCGIEIVELDWNSLIVNPVLLISIIFMVISIVIISKKLKKVSTNNKDKKILFKTTIILLIPIITFVIPYLYELYILNNCDALIKYNYQNGIVISEDTYIAVINNKAKNITLQVNPFNRKGEKVEVEYYDVVYNDNIEITTLDENRNDVKVEDEKLKSIAKNAKEKSSSAKGGNIEYIKELDISIIELTSEENSGTILGEYLYHNTDYIQKISTHGSSEEVIYYGK